MNDFAKYLVAFIAIIIQNVAASNISSSGEKSVFAHFIVGNAASMTLEDWKSDIALAQTAHIDGFALNIASNDGTNDAILNIAYEAAETLNFKMFLSFDYASTGAWSSSAVISTINKYKTYSAQFHYSGKPLVSTFIGSSNKGDWANIKEQTGCFFMPDWTDLGTPEVVAAETVIDGAFSWDAWPNGPNNKTTISDTEYKSSLESKPYMMPVSPWFYTNLPQWDKNWLWRGDDLWYERWLQVLDINPALVEIISWNDFGESHYIGPIYEMGIPSGASWYVDGMKHDGWRALLPFFIDAYKSGELNAKPTEDVLSFWYKITPNTAGGTGGTTGNTASQGQTIYPVSEVSEDLIFVSVIAKNTATLSIQIGGTSSITSFPISAGPNFYSIPMGKSSGSPIFTLSRNNKTVKNVTGPTILQTATNGLVNFNAYSGSA
ncbi:hypothetical protein DASC09_008800 [Saccharomycopsis crataegensis]|uniref:Glycoside hydrolase family 71 protein n=1 Tax=Saccharomycopsis crataegensis TaxID=43959 RepID=A0AAV5QGG9_9ASCO|nr:hypothetical protein DASC09_008800 [Saccharomycopsis crataegensis]